MKSKFALAFAIVVIPLLVKAQIEIGGYIESDSRSFLNRDENFYWNENRVNLNFQADPANNANFYSEFWIRNFGLPQVNSSRDLTKKGKSKVAPWDVSLREAYIDFYGFLSDNMDIRVGLQRIVWGTADKINPTDNLNPDDLEDIWAFGRHLGSNAIKLNYYIKDYTLTGVFIPVFTPATLPIRQWAEAFSPAMALPSGIYVQKFTDLIIIPKNAITESSMYGFKVTKNFWDYDFSLSYFYGRDDLPLTKDVTFVPSATVGMADVLLKMIYPQIRVLGVDMAGAIDDIGIWIETAAYFPDKVERTTDLTAIGSGIQKSIALSNRPYFKYVAGADYTFRNGLYINGQYIHGFLHERQQKYLENYFIFTVEKKLLNDKIKIIPIGGSIGITDFKNIGDNWGYILNPGFSFFPADNSEVQIGLRFLDGKKSTIFGKIKNNDELYLKIQYNF